MNKRTGVCPFNATGWVAVFFPHESLNLRVNFSVAASSAKVMLNEATQWKNVANVFPLRPSVPLLLRFRAHLFGPAGLHLVLIEQRVLCAIPAGRFFTHAGGEGGWRPFKWSTWRLWPVINEFAVSHGSCKETSGNKKKKKLMEKGGYSDWSGNRVSS